MGYLALCSTQKMYPLIERMLSTGTTTICRQNKHHMPQSNKATSEDLPSVAGVVLFEIFNRIPRTSCTLHRTNHTDSGEQSLPQLQDDVTLHVAEARGSCKTGLQFTSAWTHEKI